MQLQVETILCLSSFHLTLETRQKFEPETLSVPVYPDYYGGFVPVFPLAKPDESDLKAVFEFALANNIKWLRFDGAAPKVDGAAPKVDGLPLYIE